MGRKSVGQLKSIPDGIDGIYETLVGTNKSSKFIPIVVTLITILAFVGLDRNPVKKPNASVQDTVQSEAAISAEPRKWENPWADKFAESVARTSKPELSKEEFLAKTEYEKERAFESVLSENLMAFLLDFVPEMVSITAKTLVRDISQFVFWQLYVLAIIILFSIAPGIAGMFYRRSFAHWFWFSLIVLFVIEMTWMFVVDTSQGVGHRLRDHLNFPLKSLLLIEAGVIAIFLLMRLRFHNLLRLPSFSKREKENEGKNIVFCFDGTWNHPGEKDHGHSAHTNVYKLFTLLKGTPTLMGRSNANQTKCYGNRLNQGKYSKQIAFYYLGLGNPVENSGFGQMFGGAFGLGAEAIKQRAYLDLCRVYRPGDKIHVYGFSRGAAIARLFAGIIGRRGISKSVITLRIFGRMRPLLTLFGKFKDVPVEVLGCWDTVGAFGIGKNILGIPFQKINLLKELSIGDHVKRAYHLVGLDEQRDAFVPTLMNEDPTDPARVVEVWFSGNHRNVGGGFMTDRLSDGSLSFMLAHVSSGYANAKNKSTEGVICLPGDESWGLYLTAANAMELTGEEIAAFPIELSEAQLIHPDASGRIRFSGGEIYKYEPRQVPNHGIIHDSVFQRMAVAEAKYAPQSLFILNGLIEEQKKAIKLSLDSLASTQTLNSDEAALVEAWRANGLTVRKWSAVEKELRSSNDRGCRVSGRGFNPPAELFHGKTGKTASAAEAFQSGED